ncbi:YueH family protein [Staphylococcus caeli]|uniref:YueH-like family protein n=1 Tax=Staphylococcus caeli TaxID=2201815 RepID=A0A1D4ISQ0_9STAP|nr:YueH family protein [Staphylococcus caeli]SCS52391.1 yueH-like family protein [Staphylococcus caeli]SCS90773.1 yueH-like family protein [Staphylococcus caeli]
MKIRTLNYQGIKGKVYIYEQRDDQLLLIAIPDMNWSVEISEMSNQEDIHESLVIHLFTLLDESTAEQIAEDIVKWIFEK